MADAKEHLAKLTAQLIRLDKAAIHLTEIAEIIKIETEALNSTNEFAPIFTAFWSTKQAVDNLEVAFKLLTKHVTDQERGVLPAKLVEAEIDTVRVPELGRSFTYNIKYSASIIDKDKGYAWLRERGAGDLISETVNAGTLSGYLKSLVVDEGIDPPEDIFKFGSYKLIGSSKYTPKKDAVA